MIGYILRRVLAVIPVMLCVAIIVFLLLRLTPGDPATIIAGDNATTQDLERIRERLGLNDPLIVQFFTWMGQLLRGDLGVSLISNKPVTELIGQRLGPTLNLALMTITVSVLIALPLGTLAAWQHRRWPDHLVMSLSVLGFSIPVFVAGYILIAIFAIDLRWLPVQGYTAPTENLAQFLRRATLPVSALVLSYVALIARMTRASLLEVLGEDYIRTARAKGVSEARVVLRHGLRNAAVPIVTVIGAGFAMLLGGMVVTESVFNIPGIGRLTIDAVLARDYPVIQAVILLTSMIYVLFNLLIDLSYSLFDPRIRY